MDAVGTDRAAACRPSGARPVRVYKPRRAQASPLIRLVQDQFRTRRRLPAIRLVAIATRRVETAPDRRALSVCVGWLRIWCMLRLSMPCCRD